MTSGASGTGPCNPRKNSGHMAVFCLIVERSSPGSRKWVGSGTGIFLSVQVFCYREGLSFGSSEMIYNNIHQRIKEMVTD